MLNQVCYFLMSRIFCLFFICLIFTLMLIIKLLNLVICKKKSYQINDNSLRKLSDVLSNTRWHDVTDAHDANTAYDMFHDKFSQIYNDCIPLIPKKISLDRPYKPWITKGIIKSIHKKS